MAKKKVVLQEYRKGSHGRPIERGVKAGRAGRIEGRLKVVAKQDRSGRRISRDDAEGAVE